LGVNAMSSERVFPASMTTFDCAYRAVRNPICGTEIS
jgi:hypothetical protein